MRVSRFYRWEPCGSDIDLWQRLRPASRVTSRSFVRQAWVKAISPVSGAVVAEGPAPRREGAFRSGSSTLRFLASSAFWLGALRAAFFGWSLVLGWSFRLSDGLGLRTTCGSLKVTGVKLYSGSHSTGRFLSVVSRNEKIADVSLGSSRSNL